MQTGKKFIPVIVIAAALLASGSALGQSGVAAPPSGATTIPAAPNANGGAPATAAANPKPSVPKERPALSLSPAVVLLKGKPGQSTTQNLSFYNGTDSPFTFNLEAEDVIVRDGKRVFVAAGEVPDSIALTAVFDKKQVRVAPRTNVDVQATITVPANTKVRAVVLMFRGVDRIDQPNSVGMTASLGTLLTFNLSEDVRISSTPLAYTAQTESTNPSFTELLTNDGTEPVVPKGVIAVLGPNGKLVSKGEFQEQRLLPGEALTFKAELPSLLKQGSYKALATFEYEGKVLKTSELPFTVQ